MAEKGYAFALPRLVARLAGRRVRRAEFSGWEAYGLGILVFGISCVFGARLVLLFVRPGWAEALLLLFLPAETFVAYLVLYFINARVIALLRRLRLYSAPTNNPFQHLVIMSLTTVLALLFLRDEWRSLNSLGVLWLGILSSNLLALVILKIRHEP